MKRKILATLFLAFLAIIISNAQEVYIVGQDLASHSVTVTNPKTGKSLQGYGFTDEEGLVFVEQSDLDRVKKCIYDARNISDHTRLQKFCMDRAVSYYGKDSRVGRWFF